MATRRFLALALVTLAASIGCSAGSTDPFGTGSSGAGGSGGSSTTTGTSATGSATTTTGAGGSTVSSSASASATSGSGGSGGSGGAATSSASSGQGGGGGMMDLDGGAGDAGPPVNAEVYAHSAGTLYRLDPISKKVTTIGNFPGCSTVIDIALDKNGLMFGTGFGELYKINKATSACTLVSNGSYPNSLSFVPAGTVDPVNEALVGYVDASYVRINTTTGAVTTIGSLGNGGYASSGDMVSLIGGASYLTVNGNGCGDCLVEVNPTTGGLVKLIGALNHSSVFGLAYWAGVAYGFDSSGTLFDIDVQTAATNNIPIPNAPFGLSFYGAGSTTAAPLHM